MGELLPTLFPGLAAMPNWHPLVVHFPIALLSCYFLLDLAATLTGKAAWCHVAGGLLYLGTLFAAVAVALGFQAAASVAHSAAVHPILTEHYEHGVEVLGMAVLLSLWWWLQTRRAATKPTDNLSRIATLLRLTLAAVMVAVMAHGADMGGLMVYGHGVGVQAMEHEHSHDHEHADGMDHHH